MSTVANCADLYLSLIKDSDVKLEFLTEMRIEEWSQLHLASKDLEPADYSIPAMRILRI